MKKNELKKDDILVFKNNHSAVLSASNQYRINNFYDDDLNCITDDNYSIAKVYRPVYQVVYERENVKGLQKNK